MFELLVSLKYLIARPPEVRDFIEFDNSARWKRLQFYKEVYATFPATKVLEVEREYARVRQRFEGSNGKVRVRSRNSSNTVGPLEYRLNF